MSTEDESTETLQESHDGEEYFEILLFLYDMAMAVVHKNVQWAVVAYVCLLTFSHTC